MNKKMNQKKQNRMAVRQAAAKAVLRDEQNRRIQFAATNPEGEVMKNLRTTLRGLDEDAVTASRAKYGSNKVTHEKKKSLVQLSGWTDVASSGFFPSLILMKPAHCSNALGPSFATLRSSFLVVKRPFVSL